MTTPQPSDWAAKRAGAHRPLRPTRRPRPQTSPGRRPPARFATVVPAASARCSDVHDGAVALSFAQQRGLAAAVRSGGHDFAGQTSTTGLLSDLSPMDSVAATKR